MRAAVATVETPLLIPLAGDTLLGVLAAPAGLAQGTALLVVVGGPQVRVGSHRQFVQLARHLAAAGHATLRFDVRGMGDSSGSPAGFEHLHEDIAVAVDALFAARPEVRRVVLWGLCDGASAALLYLHQTRDPRVGGLVLLNPWVRSPQTLARATLRHYYLQRLRQPGFWRKLLGGSVGRAAVRGWWQNLQTARQRVREARDAASAPSGAPHALPQAPPFAARMAQAWRAFPGPILLVLSGDDVTAQEFADHARADAHWRGALDIPRVTRADLPGADHTFSGPDSGPRVLRLTLDWLRQQASTRLPDR
jgi:exosortase A-associated hydrolase 1